jgi:hypothetical protein
MTTHMITEINEETLGAKQNAVTRKIVKSKRCPVTTTCPLPGKGREVALAGFPHLRAEKWPAPD